MSERLKELEHRIKCFNSEILSFDKVKNWDEGELAELVSDGMLEEIELSKTVVCDQCSEHCTIEPKRRTIPQTGEVVGFHVCREKPDGERQIIKLERFKQWKIVKAKLVELGYCEEPEETTGSVFGGKGKKPCSYNQYEQLIDLRKGFVFLTDPPTDVRETDYSYKKREVLNQTKTLWPLLKRLCKKFDIPLEISVGKAGPSAAEINFAKGMCDKTDFVEYEAPKEKIINLEIMTAIIEDCEKPNNSINVYNNTHNISETVLRQFSNSTCKDSKEKVHGILDDVIIKLGGYFKTGKDTVSETEHEPDGTVETESKQNSFAKNGTMWKVIYNDNTGHYRDLKGMGHIAKLLAKQNKPIAAYDLSTNYIAPDVHSKNADTGADGLTTDTSIQELADNQTLKECYKRLKVIPEEVQKAEQDHDQAKQSELKKEKAKILEYVRNSTGLGKNPKAFEGDIGRARKAVSKAINTAIAKFEKDNSKLFNHLTNSITLGTNCIYSPETPQDWIL